MSVITRWLVGLRRPVRWAVVLVILVVLILVAITVSATTWEYTNSSAFCGTTCHTMPPEYTAYQISPHARVACVDCHLGQDTVLHTVPRKARELSHVVNALTQAYEPPIYVKGLRPARDTCERCHNPDKFSHDTFVEVKRFGEDSANSQARTYLILKTGGGTKREGLGRGIHWHIENEVEFFSDDPLKQTIPYVRTIGPGGEVTEYFDVEAGLPPDFGQQVEDQLHRMDCIDCHTRISHLFRSPSDAIDDALARRKIDSSIPQIKLLGEVTLSKPYTSTEEGLQAIEGLEDWYREYASDYYAENQQAVRDAIEELKRIFTVTVFPNLHVGWQTHPSNAGHREFPGCFRCHDGKHTSPEGETVRLECNICHSIPEVVEAGMAAPVLSIDKPNEPESHLDSNWLARHRYQFDETCAACHDLSNPGGTDNTSFCSNSACHAVQWKYVNLNAPAIRALVEPPPLPGNGEALPVPHPIGPRTDCDVCHATDAVLPVPADHTSYERPLCTQCHQPMLAEGEDEPPPVSAAPIPHALEGRRDRCLTCHAEDGFKPYPTDHAGRTTETCLLCHEVAVPEGAIASAGTEGDTAVTESIGSGAPVTPADHAGRENLCLSCHEPGGGVKPSPADHEGREVDLCLSCHVLAEEEQAVEASATPAAKPEAEEAVEAETETEATAETEEAEEKQSVESSATPLATPEAEETAEAETKPEETQDAESEVIREEEPQADAEGGEEEAKGPSLIPHTLEGRDDCLLCHNLDGVKPFPADHEGRTSVMCQACHEPGGEGGG